MDNKNKPVTELKEIPLDATSFEANGKTYFIKTSLSVERFRWYEKYQLNFGMGRTFDNIVKALDKSVELANKGAGLQAWNIIFNMRDAITKDLDKRSHQAFYLCALFMVTENEDLTQWDEALAERKIKDWNTEGISAVSFFRIASNLVNGFLDVLEAHSQDILGIQEAMKPLEELTNESTNSISSGQI